MTSCATRARGPRGWALRRHSLLLFGCFAATALLGGPAHVRATDCSCPGDLTINALQDGRDLQLFVECMLGGPSVAPGCECADVNGDAALDDFDVAGLVAILLARQSCYTLERELEPGTWHTPPASPCNEGACGGRGDGDAGTGIYLFSGEAYHVAQDLRIRGRGFDFVWARKYRSRFGPDTVQGNGWDFSYNIYIEQAGADLVLHDGNSRADTYVLQPSGKWAREEFFREIEQNIDDSFTLLFADTGKWNFHAFSHPTAPGRVSAILDRNGNTMSFDYDAQGRLVTIHDTLDTPAHNRDITVSYDANGFIASVTDFTGRSVTYQYYDGIEPDGSFGDLKSVTSPAVVGTPHSNDFPAGKTTVYTYTTGFADDRLNHNLLTVTDPKGQTYLSYVYAAVNDPDDIYFDRAIRQVWGDPGDIIDWTITGFSTVGTYRIIVTVNDRMGNVREYAYDALNRLVRKREFTGRAPDPDAPTTGSENLPINKLRSDDPNLFETNWEYNGNSLVTRVVHPNLNETQNVYEADLNPAAEPRIRGNLRQVTRDPGPPGGDQAQIVESFTYETGFGGCGCGTNFVKTHTDGRGNTTSHTYDATGNRLHTTHRIPTIAEDFEYDAVGQLTKHTLPENGSGSRREDVFSYYAPADGCMNGYLKDQIVDQLGFALTTTYEYDCLGRLTRQVDPRGNDSLTEYNALDQVVREQSREALPGIRYEKLTWYDANDNVVRSDIQNLDETGNVPPGGNTHFSTITEYEVLNYPTRTCREKGSAPLGPADLDCSALTLSEFIVEEYEFDANRNRTLVRYGQATSGADLFNTLTTLYDERDLVFRSIRAAGSPDQSTDQTDYDGNGNIRATRQGLEDVGGVHVTQSAYDGYDRRTSMTDAMGNVETYHYDANGNTTSQRTDGELNDVALGAGNVRLTEITHQYDAMDRQTQLDIAHFDTETQADIGDGQSTTQWTYADNSQVVSVTDDHGHTTTSAYDTGNRLLAVTDAKLNTVANTYDANSNVTQSVEVDKSDLLNPDEMFTTQYAYDALDRLTVTTDNVANVNQYAYDSRNNRVLYTDARGKLTRYHYDGVKRLVRTVHDMDADGPDDAQPGDLNPDIVTTQSWDDSSRLTGQTDDNGNTTAYQYDSLNRPTATDYADCTTDSTAYDVHDNAVTTTDANGSVVAYTYDFLNRVTNKTIVSGPAVSADTTFENYQYDGRSRFILALDNDSLARRGTGATSGYDSLSNVLRETQQITNPPSPPRMITAAYDGESNQTVLVYPGGRILVRSYDVLDRPAQVNDIGPVALIATYNYIGPSRLERRDHGNGTRFEPGYDGVRRMTRSFHYVIAVGTPLDDRAYGWDPMHNKLFMDNLLAAPPPDLKNYIYDAANRLLSSAHHTFANPPCITGYMLDGVGNRTQVLGCDNPGPYTLDPTLCEPGDFQMNQYTTTPFDARNHDLNGNLADLDNGSTAVLTYDYRNRLVEYFDSVAGISTTYKYDCLGRRIQKDVGGVITRFYYDGSELIEEQTGANVVAATYVYSKGPHSRLQMVRGGQKYFYHENDLGSVMKVSDSHGNIVSGAEYLDYGALDTSVNVQPPDQAQAFRSDLSNQVPGPQAIADDFTLTAPETITRLRWWGTYTTPGFVAHSHDFHITIFDDNLGAPGNPVYQETAGNIVVVTPTNQFVGGEPEQRYEYTLNNPFQAQAGVTYWLSIENTLAQPGVASPWKWESSSTGNNLSYWGFNQFGPWNQQPADLAFELHADPPDIGNPFLFHGHYFNAESISYWTNAARTMDPFTGGWRESTSMSFSAELALPSNAGLAHWYMNNNPTSQDDPWGPGPGPRRRLSVAGGWLQEPESAGGGVSVGGAEAPIIFELEPTHTPWVYDSQGEIVPWSGQNFVPGAQPDFTPQDPPKAPPQDPPKAPPPPPPPPPVCTRTGGSAGGVVTGSAWWDLDAARLDAVVQGMNDCLGTTTCNRAGCPNDINGRAQTCKPCFEKISFANEVQGTIFTNFRSTLTYRCDCACDIRGANRCR